MPTPIDPGRRGKPVTRQTVLALRDALSAEQRSTASAWIAERTLEALGAPSGVVGLYAAKGTEVETARLDALVRAAGWTVAYPRVVAGTRAMTFHGSTIEELVASKLGLREPAVDRPTIAVGDIAAFVLPGLAFDRAGGRVGWGRGHYDATLTAASAAAVRIGLAYECQLVESVPSEAHDIPLNIIITEAATYRVSG